MQLFLLLVSVWIAGLTATPKPNKTVTWFEGMDSRALPQWYDEAKVGIFVHWGVYSVPAMMSEWFWFRWKTSKTPSVIEYMKKNYPPDFSYQEFAPMFKAEHFHPNMWAKLFKLSGAKYVVLTSKHHDGFTLFPSNYSPNWNSVEIGPKRDIVQNLSNAVLKQGLKFGLYYSVLEWFHPLYLLDKTSTSRLYIDQKMLPELRQLVEDYKPSLLWSDGCWEARDAYWSSQKFLNWLYHESDVKGEVVVNDRWGPGYRGRHGDFFNHEDEFNNYTLENHKWENAFPIDIHSWGYRAEMRLSDIRTVHYMLIQLVSTVSCGGNVLINVGPTKEGIIPLIFQERLLSLGEWLTTNGEAIYKSSPWTHQRDIYNDKVWYTCTKKQYNATHPTAIPGANDTITAVYAITLVWPAGNLLKLVSVSTYLLERNCKIELFGYKLKYLKWSIFEGMTYINFPNKWEVKSENAWTVKITEEVSNPKDNNINTE